MIKEIANVELIDITPNAMDKLAKIASVCYQSTPSERVVKKILDLGHWSVFEHCYATFKINMSVAVLLQMTRHRHLSFTVQSSRATELTDFYRPDDERVLDTIDEMMTRYHIRVNSGNYEHDELLYMLPKAAIYEVYVTGNFRAWLEYLPKRMCERAMKEHRKIAEDIKFLLAEHYPEIFDDVRPRCEYCHDKNCDFSREKAKKD